MFPTTGFAVSFRSLSGWEDSGNPFRNGTISCRPLAFVASGWHSTRKTRNEHHTHHGFPGIPRGQRSFQEAGGRRKRGRGQAASGQRRE